MLAARTGFYDAGHGYDVFGLHPPAVEWALRAAHPWYQHYFKVQSRGVEHIPERGPAILIANHSGALPIDGAMLWVDVMTRTRRLLRMVSDRFIPGLPFASSVLARVGVVSGTRANVRRLIARGELLTIFPEGVTGPRKSFRDRYQLQQWRMGHAELAIRYQVPIVPVGIVGVEEAWPLVRSFSLRPLGIPYVPIPMTPVPLPMPVVLHYGPPIELARRYSIDDADDPKRLAAAAAETRDAVRLLIERGRAEMRMR